MGIFAVHCMEYSQHGTLYFTRDIEDILDLSLHSQYIFVNMFTGVYAAVRIYSRIKCAPSYPGVVVENFSYVFQVSGPTSITREEMRAFKKVWAEFDPARKGYIQRANFVPFFGVRDASSRRWISS